MENLVRTIKTISRKHPGYLGSFLPIRLWNYSNLKRNLDREVQAGYVNEQFHPEFPHLKIYKYAQSAVIERHWNKFTLMARGLILDTKAKNVLATPFIKFFNNGEVVGNEIFEKDFTASEKMDGSMGTVFYYQGWRVATGGSFVSEQANWATKHLNEKLATTHLERGVTYLVEIIYPENKIVIHYDEEALYLLAAFKKGKELNPFHLGVIADLVRLKRPELYNFGTIDKILQRSKMLGHNEEGYVIRFKSGVRIKIKGDEYCRIHKLICRVTPIAIWEMLVAKDDLDRIKQDLPEEMESDFDQIVLILNKSLKTLQETVNRLHDRTKHLSDKGLGLEWGKKESVYIDNVNEEKLKGYVFAKRKSAFDEKLEDTNFPMRRKVFSHFRPTSNRLEGYVPSSAVNRFQSSTVNDG